MQLTIRPAVKADSETILQFITELAVYEKAADQVIATTKKIDDCLFASNPTVFALMAEVDQQAVGFAVYFFNYSTWQGQHGLYLEDLYVQPAYRNTGIGRHLIKKLAQIAVANDCGRFEWSVLDWNQPAIDFYDSIGAKQKEGWLGYQLAGDALNHFADTP